MKGILTTLLCLLATVPLRADDTIAIDAELTKTWPNNRTVNIVFHGHSVPSGYHVTPRVKPFESYPHLFRVKMAERYPNAVFNVITTSIGGENAIAGAARFAADVLPHKPDLIFIDYALNDRPVPIADVETAWRSMIAEAKTAGVPLVLVTPTGATNADFSNPSDPLTIRAQLIRDLAEEEDVMLADVSAAWKAELDSGTEQSAILSTGNHPNLTGHQLAADVIFQAYLDGLGPVKTAVASDFPRDRTSNSFTTEDGLVTFTTTNTFSGQGDFLGDSGGTANRVNSWDGNETLQIALAADVQLKGFAVRWTKSDLIIAGLANDPGAVISPANGTASWDDGNKILTLDLPWDAGAVRTITFANPIVSTGNTLSISFTDSAPDWQASFVSFDYERIAQGAGASLFRTTPALVENRVEFPFTGLRGHSYALQSSFNLDPATWQIIDSVGPLALTRETLLVDDANPLFDRRFYRVAITVP